MPVTPSPLRYPGGKTALYRMVARIIQDNELKRCHYVEPYAGGAGLALSLLFNSYVHEIHLNDIDLSLYALWDTILNNTEPLCHLIEKTAISIENWHKAKAIQKNKRNATWIELAFSTLFLNRTNRSGIIEGGVIGGLASITDIEKNANKYISIIVSFCLISLTIYIRSSTAQSLNNHRCGWVVV